MGKNNTVFQSIFILLFISLFLVLFYPCRCNDNSMLPGMAEGDLIVCYRFNKHYLQNDVIVLKYKDVNQARRVVAIEGDTVDIKDSHLVINGYEQNEIYSVGPTNAYVNKTVFPLTLKKEEVFLLADSRENASDSRAYGPVNVSKTKGVVLAVMRHRGL